MQIEMYKKIAKTIEFIGLILLIFYFINKNLIFSSLGLILGGFGALAETILTYKETKRLDFVKTISFSILIILGFYLLFNLA